MAVLSLKNLIKTFDGRRVVNSVSMDITSSQVVGLLGPNGAGKTTTFYMAVGMLKPDSGQIFLNEEDVNRFSHSYSGPKRDWISSPGNIHIPKAYGSGKSDGDSGASVAFPSGTRKPG